jgi:hypothetical protein
MSTTTYTSSSGLTRWQTVTRPADGCGSVPLPGHWGAAVGGLVAVAAAVGAGGGGDGVAVADGAGDTEGLAAGAVGEGAG